MIRLFQFVLLVLGLSLIALASAIATMHFAIHGAEIKTPNFKGLTAQEALDKAAQLGVEMTIDNRVYSAEMPAGRVLAQSPSPGAIVRREWHVRATESLGPQSVAIPNLVGRQQRAAIMQIRRLGLEPGIVARMPWPTAQPDTVIAQDPPAGAAGVERPSIGMIVGDAPPAETATYVMPDFVGRQYAAAAATISRLGLKLGPAAYASAAAISDPANAPSGTAPAGTVLEQKPLAGYSIDAATPIELTVAR